MTHWSFKCNRSTIQRFLPSCGAAREYLSSAAGEAAPSRAGPVTPSLAVNTGSTLTLGGQTAFWLHSSPRKGAWSSQWVSAGSAVQKRDDKKTNQPHLSVRIKMRGSAACGKIHLHEANGAQNQRGGTGGGTFPLVLLLTSSQKNALIKQPCWPSCNSASTLQHQAIRRAQECLSKSVPFLKKKYAEIDIYIHTFTLHSFYVSILAPTDWK